MTRTLADTVGADMQILFVGLNPSLRSVEAQVGFVTPGNRFWPALLEAGLATTDRDPAAALRDHGIGMTDIVKRPTRTAAELLPDEYRTGIERVERLVAERRPNVTCFVGLTGWRTAVNKSAVAGPIEAGFGGRPAYLMPSTSGLDAHCQLPDFVRHLQAAAALCRAKGSSD